MSCQRKFDKTPDYGRASLMQAYGDVGDKSQRNNPTLAP